MKYEERNKDRFIYQYGVFIVVVLLGVMLSLFLFHIARNWEETRTRAQFEKAVDNSISSLKRVFHENVNALQALASFYTASQEVERLEFRRFVHHWLSHSSGLQTLEWIPRVPHSQRSAYEERARADGFPDFQITEMNESGVMVRAERRDEYFPVYFIEPYDGNESALGYDLASDANRLSGLNMARDTAQIIATDRLRLVQEKGDQFGILVFEPVYQKGKPTATVEQRRRHLAGFMLGVFRIEQLIETALMYLVPQGVDFYLFDDYASFSDRFLYFHASRTRISPVAPLADEAQLRQGLYCAETLDIAQRKWLIIARPAPDYFSAKKGSQPWILLFGGLLFTGLLSGYLLLIQDRIAKTRKHTSEILNIKKGLDDEIAERKRTEDALRESKEHYQLLIDISPDAIVHTSLDGTILFCNKHAARMFGFESPQEMVGKDSLQFMNPGDEHIAKRNAKILFDRGVIRNAQYDMVRKDGTPFPVEVNATLVKDAGDRPHSFIGTIRDISERISAEERETSIGRILDTLRNEIYIFDSKTLKFIQVNQGALDNIGYSMEELREMTPLNLKPEYTLETFTRLLEPLLTNKQEIIKFTTVHMRKDRSLYPVEVHVQCSTFRNAPVFIAMILDISEQRKLEAQLRHAQKMEAVGQLAGGVAHDFNNILTAIFGYGNILQTKMTKDDPLRLYVDNILASSEKASTLTRSLLAFSRKQIMQPMPADLNVIVMNLERLLIRIIGEDIELEAELHDEDLIVMADTGQIEQVLMNFAANARDAMPDGGTLTLKTNTADLDDEFIRIHGYGNTGRYALVSVTDTGVGMDRETQEKIFEPFFTTKEPGKGTGLGLAMAYGIIKQHNGYVNVSSKLGKETTFTIYLPIVQSEVKQIESEEVETPKGGSETILVAEDDEEVRTITATILEEFGYTVIEAVDGQEAFEKFMDNSDIVKLLLLDVIMPRKNGKEAYEDIRTTRPDIKALFISGYSGDILESRGIIEQEFSFIYKPIAQRELLAKVRETLDR